jgi:hypothetical protein
VKGSAGRRTPRNREKARLTPYTSSRCRSVARAALDVAMTPVGLTTTPEPPVRGSVTGGRVSRYSFVRWTATEIVVHIWTRTTDPIA